MTAAYADAIGVPCPDCGAERGAECWSVLLGGYRRTPCLLRLREASGGPVGHNEAGPRGFGPQRGSQGAGIGIPDGAT